jgi:hypothetical protein
MNNNIESEHQKRLKRIEFAKKEFKAPIKIEGGNSTTLDYQYADMGWYLIQWEATDIMGKDYMNRHPYAVLSSKTIYYTLWGELYNGETKQYRHIYYMFETEEKRDGYISTIENLSNQYKKRNKEYKYA